MRVWGHFSDNTVICIYKKISWIAPCPLRAQSLQNHHSGPLYYYNLGGGGETLAATVYNTQLAHSHSLNNSELGTGGQFLSTFCKSRSHFHYFFFNQQVSNIKANSWEGALQRRHQGLPGRWCALPKSPPSRCKDTDVDRRCRAEWQLRASMKWGWLWWLVLKDWGRTHLLTFPPPTIRRVRHRLHHRCRPQCPVNPAEWRNEQFSSQIFQVGLH